MQTDDNDLPAHVIRPLLESGGGGYLIEFPDFPGCMADGETPEEAKVEGQDALLSYKRALKELSHGS